MPTSKSPASAAVKSATRRSTGALSYKGQAYSAGTIRFLLNAEAPRESSRWDCEQDTSAAIFRENNLDIDLALDFDLDF